MLDGLKSTNRPVREKTVWGLDTEDDNKGKVFQISATDGKHFHHFTDRDDFIRWVGSSFDEPVYMNATNLEYDIINLFGHRLELLDFRLKNGGLSIVSARLRGSRVTFYDTLNHTPFGVKRLGEMLDLPKLEMDFSGWDYVDRDALITQRYVAEMQARYNKLGANFNATLPSSALDLYRRHFLPFHVSKVPDETLDSLFTGYYGGRVEVFNVAPVLGTLWYIDVNSMYPAVMRRAYPNPNKIKKRKKLDLDNFGVASVTVNIPKGTYFPPLAFRDVKSKRLIFPTGCFTGSWTTDELRALRERGGKIESCQWCISFPDSCYPFTQYVEALYRAKQHAPNELERYAAKLFMNSLYGKMGERVDMVSLMNIDDVPEDKTALCYGNVAFVNHGMKYPEHTNAIWAIYTTAYARLLLLESMEQIQEAGGSVLYCDTDSIIYKSRKRLHDESDDLGGWKLEGKYTFGHFLQPKLYCLKDGSEVKVRAKGVPRDFAYQFFNEGTATFSRPYKLRGMLRNGFTGNIWFKQTKQRRTGYTKRRVLDNGETVALHLRR